MAISLPKGLNQLPSSSIKKWPNIKDKAVIKKFRTMNKGRCSFLDTMPTPMMEKRNNGNKKLASWFERWLLYS